MFKNLFIALVVIVTGTSIFLFNSIYEDAKNYKIKELIKEQAIHAKQSARGIEDYFISWTQNLDSLSKMDSIIDNDNVDKRYLNLFYEANKEQIKSIAYLDEKGVILYSFPINRTVGMDISDQNHVSVLLRDHKPIISDVFKAVEGFDSIALHVPIFRGGVFKGSISILVDFESIAKRYLDVIQIGETGYAWVISRDGTVLYSPVPGVTGKSVFEFVKDYPSLTDMVSEMLKGHEGSAAYTFDRIGELDVGQTWKIAVYTPVQVGNTFWSIAVASAEQDVLSGLISFRNKLALVIGALFICGIVFSALGAKAWFILKEEDKRKKLELELQQKRDELAHVTRVSMVGQLASTLAHELNQPLGAILRNAEAAMLFLQNSSPDLNELRAIMEDIRKDDQRAAEVIDRMRVMMKQRQIEKAGIDFNLLTSEAIAFVQPEADKRQVQMVLRIDTTLPSIHGDKVQLQQVLINLLLNALDAVDDNPPGMRLVTIGAWLVGSTLEVAVNDNGHCIAEDKIQHIFEPFFTTKPNGLGMGLVISRSIIEAHEGRLWATNNETCGATFTFTLPVVMGGEAK